MTATVPLRGRPLAIPFGFAFSAALFAASVLSACASANDPSLTLPASPNVAVQMGGDFTLAPGESVIANPGALTFAFTGVTDDSRCPTNALIQCVWAGSARVSLRVTGRNGSRDVTIETMPLRDTVTVDRFLVRLVTVAPAKLTTAPIPAASYRATLRVTTK